MEVWELNLLHDGDIKRICMCSDEQPLFEMAVDSAFDLFAKINEWPLKQENCHASVSINDKLHSILVKISTQDDNTVELWEYKYTSTMVSNVPAENYEMLTVLCNGTYMNIKGHVKIVYDSNAPYIEYKSTNTVNADSVIIHVQKGQIKNNGVSTVTR